MSHVAVLHAILLYFCQIVACDVVAMLEKVHGVKSLEDIGFTPDMKEKTARVAPYIRDRITFMRILKFYDFYDDVIK